MSPNAVLAWLRRRWWAVLVATVVLGYLAWVTHGIVDVSAERQSSRKRIESSALESERLARVVVQQNETLQVQGEDIKRALSLIEGATSKDAQDRGDATLAFAIGELRRSSDCVGFYFAGERGHPACVEVDARLDAIRRGLDPFPKPPTPGGTP